MTPQKPTCPICNSENVKAITVWHMASGPRYFTEPPQPMFACQESSCRHKWPRQSDTDPV